MDTPPVGLALLVTFFKFAANICTHLSGLREPPPRLHSAALCFLPVAISPRPSARYNFSKEFASLSLTLTPAKFYQMIWEPPAVSAHLC